MRVSVIGTGYVGLVTGACLCEIGHQVVCVDLDQEKVERINRSESPIYEPGLAELLRVHAGDRLTATTDLESALRDSELSLVTVGTPFEGDKTDLSSVENSARQIGRALRRRGPYHTVVVKSTVPPGTTDGLVLPVLEHESRRTAGRDFGVAMNPEFLREGSAVADFMSPDRLVFGSGHEKALAALEELYAPFAGVDRMEVSARTAEFIKYASNSLLATLISFSNEMANLVSAARDVDICEVLAGVHLDHRVSPILENGSRVTPGVVKYLAAGCGFGGSCFPKDVRALAAYGRAAGVPMPLLEAVVRVNDAQPEQMIQLLRRRFDSLDGRAVTVLGLAFKPGTDDMRESPAIPVVRSLREEGATVTVYDPVAGEAAAAHFGEGGVTVGDNLERSLDGAEAILLVTAWPEFLELPHLLASRSPQPLVVDGRRMIDPSSVEHYEGIGA